MKPQFPRINKAITYTLQYFEDKHILEYMQAFSRIARNQSFASYKAEHWEAFLYDLHEQMEAEILQTVFTCNHRTMTYMFEELRDWLNIDWRLKAEPETALIWRVVEEHNLKTDTEFLVRVNMEVEKFRNTEEFTKYGENEPFEKTTTYGSLLKVGDHRGIPFTQTHINRKYYCIEFTVDFLDYYEVNKYIALVTRIITNFRAKIEKHLTLFDAGKYMPVTEIVTQKQLLEASPSPDKLLESSPEKNELLTPGPKLQTSLNGEQLLYLFQKLMDVGVIEAKTQKEVCEFIAGNFWATSNGKLGTSISATRLTKIWKESEPKTAAHLKDIFIQLMNKAIEDNPNKIK